MIILTTSLAPIVWGSTYLTTTMFLPPDRPLLAGTMRALPAGILLLIICRKLPQGEWWWKSWVLGTLNIGAFFMLLFVAAYRLPGGVAAIVGGVQPLIVAVLASKFLSERLTMRVMMAGVAGIAGVALITLQAQARLDALGVAAALGGAVSMAFGLVLTKKWGQPERPLVTTSWQLIAGGLTLVPVMLMVEGLPNAPLTAANWGGYAYLSLVGTAFAYVVWFRGLSQLPASTTAFLSLLSPVVAILLGLMIAGETLTLVQGIGVAIVLGSIVLVIRRQPGASEGFKTG